MGNYNFNAPITGNNNHFGDVYNYSSPQDFLIRNKELQLSDSEIEIVKLIFDRTTSEEKANLLESLKGIKSDKGTDEEKKKFVLSFNPLLKLLKSTGEKIAVGLISKFLIDFATKHGFLEFVNQMLSNV